MEDFSQSILRKVASNQQRGRLVDQAYAQLREQIESGALGPGSVIYEADFVSQFNMSRTPVREALQRLRTEGFLVQLDRGFLVVELSDEDVGNVYGVRGVLEGMAARQAARRKTRLDLAVLEDNLDAMARAMEVGDMPLVVELSEAFHDAFASASHNSYLESMLRSVRRFLDPYRKRWVEVPGLQEQVLREHRRIYREILNGGSDESELAARDHSRHTLRALLRAEIHPPEVSDPALRD